MLLSSCQEWYCEKDYKKIIETQRQKDLNKKEAKQKKRNVSTTESNEEVVTEKKKGTEGGEGEGEGEEEKKEEEINNGEENDAAGAGVDDDDDENEEEEEDDLLQEKWEAKQLGMMTDTTRDGDDIMNIKMATMQTQLNRIEALLTNKNYRKKEEAKCRWKTLKENVKIVTQIMRESKEEEDKKECP